MKFSGLFNYELDGKNVIGSKAVRHEASLPWPAFSMDGRQSPGEKNVGEQLSWN